MVSIDVFRAVCHEVEHSIKQAWDAERCAIDVRADENARGGSYRDFTAESQAAALDHLREPAAADCEPEIGQVSLAAFASGN